MFWVQAIIAVSIVCATVLVASGRGDGLELPARDELGLWAPTDRPVQAADLENLRIGVAARGYRMDEVDAVLNRLGGEIADRDVTIDDLERRAEIARATADEPRGAVDRSVWGAPSAADAAATTDAAEGVAAADSVATDEGDPPAERA